MTEETNIEEALQSIYERLNLIEARHDALIAILRQIMQEFDRYAQ